MSPKGTIHIRVAPAGTVLYNRDPIAKIDAATLRSLKEKALAKPGACVRLCLHRSPEEPVHEMIIVHTREAYIRPHRHEGETESFLMLEGRMRVVLFDDHGTPVDRFEMTEKPLGGCFLCRVEKGTWHTMLPLTPVVVFVETTQGPFDAERHNTYAEWAPSPEDAEAVRAFLRTLAGS